RHRVSRVALSYQSDRTRIARAAPLRGDGAAARPPPCRRPGVAVDAAVRQIRARAVSGAGADSVSRGTLATGDFRGTGSSRRNGGTGFLARAPHGGEGGAVAGRA